MAPAVKRLLPPFSASGARSKTTTRAPCSCAASAAQKAAFPAPTTMTSKPDCDIACSDNLIAEGGQFVVHFRQCLEQVGDQTIVGDLENRRLFVLVDRGDDLRILHAG